MGAHAGTAALKHTCFSSLRERSRSGLSHMIQTEVTVASRTMIHLRKNDLRAGTFWRLVVTDMYTSSLQCVYLAPQCPLLPHTVPTTHVSTEHVSGEKINQKTNGLTEFQRTPPTCQQGKGGRWEEGAVREKK